MKKKFIISKLLNNSKVVYNNYNLLNIYNLFNYNYFIIFLDYKQLKNKDMYLLKNELYELNVNSKILLNKEKNKLFNSNFTFLGSNLFCIFIKDIKKFIEISKILIFKKLIFFYSFKKKISNYINNNQLEILGGKVFITIHFLIFKLIKNIIILLLYFLLILIKYINIK
jgi:hypothetical protein